MDERRGARRAEMKSSCTFSLDGHQLPARVVNLSDQGALLRFASGSDASVTDADLGSNGSLLLTSVSPHRLYTGEIIRRYFAGDALHIVLRFWKKYREIPTT
jgi:hypothetical protein